MASNSPHVIAVNLINGIPYDDNSFDVVYHSQVLEHIPKNEAAKFIGECYRVLKPGGIIRVVVPDLENIVREYLRLLDINWKNKTAVDDANYEWIVLEMYDQTVRNQKGGLMFEYLKQNSIANEKYILDRIGYIGNDIRNYLKMGGIEKFKYIYSKISSRLRSTGFLANLIKDVKLKAKHVFLTEEEKLFLEIGKFRLGGEIHYWMYDKYSLGKLLNTCGFERVDLMGFDKSLITGWNEFELDIKNGAVYDPTSLFMEAIKPV